MRVLAVVTLLHGCCDADVPCQEWMELGESYSIELVQHLATEEHHGPFGSYTSPSVTCGQHLDFAIGERFRIVTEGRKNQTERCCYDVAARPEFEGVEISDKGLSRRVGALEWRGRVSIAGCDGSYRLVVAKTSTQVLEASRPFVATDFVLYREFSPTEREDEACLTEGSQLSRRVGTCIDAWALQVQDSGGRRLSSTFTPPEADDASGPVQAGAADAGDTDGGS